MIKYTMILFWRVILFHRGMILIIKNWLLEKSVSVKVNSFFLVLLTKLFEIEEFKQFQNGS